MKCKNCKNKIPQERIDNCINQRIIFCEKKCVVKYHNKIQSNLLKNRPDKKCQYCGKTTNKVKEFCNDLCYRLKSKQENSEMIKTEDFKTLNKGMLWDISEPVLF